MVLSPSEHNEKIHITLKSLRHLSALLVITDIDVVVVVVVVVAH